MALLPCFALLIAAVSLAGAAIQHFTGKVGSLLIGVLFIIVGGSGAGGVGIALLPSYWQTIGAFLPPRHAVLLYQGVLYFGGHNIVTPIAVLAAYALVGAAIVVVVEHRQRKTEQPVAAAAGTGEAASSTGRPRMAPKQVIAPIGFAVLLTTLFAVNYMPSGHEPIAKDMPFGVVGSSSLPDDAQGPLFSLDVKQYSSAGQAKDAMDKGEIYGALVAGDLAPAAEMAARSAVLTVSDLH